MVWLGFSYREGDGLPEPQFEQRAGEFVTTIWRDWLTEKVMAGLQLTERQKKAALLVKTSKRITNATYQQATGASRPTAIRDLADLVAKGVFTRHGAGRSAYYTLTPKRLINDSIDSPRRSAGIDSKSTQLTQPVPPQRKPGKPSASRPTRGRPKRK